MPFIEPKRARRRRLTLSVAKRRRDEHLRRFHFDATTGLTDVDCVCELADTYFAKRAALACDCRKRRKGRPKVAAGMCDIGNRARIYTWRREARAVRWTAEATEPEWTWPRGRRGAKPYTIEEFSPRRGTWSVNLKRYRRVGDRDQALAALRQRYPRRVLRPGPEV